MRLTLHPIDRSPDREITMPDVVCGRGFGTLILSYPQDESRRLPDWTPTHEGTRLRAERVERREGLRACAERIGLSATQLSALESGRQTLRAEEWVAVLEAGRR